MVTTSCYGLAKKLTEDAGNYFDKKRINPEVYKLGRKFLRGLVYGLLMSDGDGISEYFTSNKYLVSDLIKLFFMAGYYPSTSLRRMKESILKCGRVIKPKNQAYVVAAGASGKNKLYSSHVKTVKYSGKVWCLEVDGNHNFLIERNGKISFSGNSTSELFGKSYSTDLDGEKYQDENTPFIPQSPYAISKLAAHHACRLYRDSYGIFVSCGILGNHESPRRGENFVTRKITLYLGRLNQWIKSRQNNFSFTSKELVGLDGEAFPKLHLGNLDAYRDWGHAKSYMEIAHAILQLKEPDDYVVGTGKSRTVREFVKSAFEFAGINNYEDFVFIDPSFYRPCEVDFLKMRPRKLKEKLGFEFTNYDFYSLVQEMVKADEKI
jgi:GDP-mannose 4,6-dehydratase